MKSLNVKSGEKIEYVSWLSSIQNYVSTFHFCCNSILRARLSLIVIA